MRYDEFSVLITIAKDARNDHPARVLSLIWLLSLSLSLSFLVFLEFVRKPSSILFRSISAFSIDVAYTMDFKRPHKWKSNGFKSGERAGYAIGPPRPIHLFAKCWFKNCLATRLKRGGAPSCMNRIQSLISTGASSNISCKRVLKKSTYFVPVSFPKDPIKNLSIIPAHTFKLNWCWCLECTITCWFLHPILCYENWIYHPPKLAH